MKKAILKNLKIGDIVSTGEIGKGKFEIAEVRKNSVMLKDGNVINMRRAEIKSFGDGEICHSQKGCIYILNKREIKEVEKIKDKFKMLDSLKESGDEE